MREEKRREDPRQGVVCVLTAHCIRSTYAGRCGSGLEMDALGKTAESSHNCAPSPNGKYTTFLIS